MSAARVLPFCRPVPGISVGELVGCLEESGVWVIVVGSERRRVFMKEAVAARSGILELLAIGRYVQFREEQRGAEFWVVEVELSDYKFQPAKILSYDEQVGVGVVYLTDTMHRADVSEQVLAASGFVLSRHSLVGQEVRVRLLGRINYLEVIDILPA